MDDRAEALASQNPTEEIAAAFAENNETPAGETEGQESVATEEQAQEGQPESEAKGDLPDEYAEALKTFKTDKGEVDLGKLAKSYVEAQKLIGKTAKERERLNRLPEYEQKARLADDITRLANSHPDVALAIQTAVARERGQVSPPVQAQQPQRAVQPENVKQKVTELMTAGHIDEAVSLAVESSPAYQRMMQLEDERRAAEARRAQEEQRQTLSREVSEFKRKYTGVIWDDAGAVKDQEMYDKIVNDTVRRTATYEDALKLAAYELGRMPTKKAEPDPAKAQAMNQPKGAKPKAKPRSSEAVFGMDEETLMAKLTR